MKLWQECLATLTLHLSLRTYFHSFLYLFFCWKAIAGILMLAEKRIYPNAGTPPRGRTGIGMIIRFYFPLQK